MDSRSLSEALNSVHARSIWGFWFRLGAFLCGVTIVGAMVISSCTKKSDPIEQIKNEYIERSIDMRARLAYERSKEIERLRVDPVVEPEPEPEKVPMWLEVQAWVTGYCPCPICCGKHSDGKTSMGDKIDFYRGNSWGIAADQNILPRNTQIIIPGYDPTIYKDPDSPWPVDDTGGRMRKAASKYGVIHVDARFIRHRSAKKFGSKWRKIYVYTKWLSKDQIDQLMRMSDEAGKSKYRGQ